MDAVSDPSRYMITSCLGMIFSSAKIYLKLLGPLLQLAVNKGRILSSR